MKHAERKGGFQVYLGELRAEVESFCDEWKVKHLVKPSLGEAIIILVRFGLEHFRKEGEK